MLLVHWKWSPLAQENSQASPVITDARGWICKSRTRKFWTGSLTSGENKLVWASIDFPGDSTGCMCLNTSYILSPTTQKVNTEYRIIMHLITSSSSRNMHDYCNDTCSDSREVDLGGRRSLHPHSYTQLRALYYSARKCLHGVWVFLPFTDLDRYLTWFKCHLGNLARVLSSWYINEFQESCIYSCWVDTTARQLICYPLWLQATKNL